MKSAVLFGLLASLTIGLSGCDDFGGFGNLDQRNTLIDDANLDNAEAAPVTPLAAIPTTGTVTYDGVVAASTTGAYVGSLYADMSMDVDFAGGAITGSITNVDLVDDATGNVVQGLTGTLALTGDQTDTPAGGIVGATATGNLTGAGVVTGTTTAVLVFAGSVRSDVTPADTVYGTMSGGMAGGFALDLSQGKFFGTTN